MLGRVISAVMEDAIATIAAGPLGSLRERIVVTVIAPRWKVLHFGFAMVRGATRHASHTSCPSARAAGVLRLRRIAWRGIVLQRITEARFAARAGTSTIEWDADR